MKIKNISFDNVYLADKNGKAHQIAPGETSDDLDIADDDVFVAAKVNARLVEVDEGKKTAGKNRTPTSAAGEGASAV